MEKNIDINSAINEFCDSVGRLGTTESPKANLVVKNLKGTSAEIQDIEELYSFISTISTKEKMKIFIVLFIKGFTWKRELRDTYGINNFRLDKVISQLQELGLIITRDFYSIDEIYQEAIYKSTPNFNNWEVNNPTIFVMSNKGKQFGLAFKKYLQEKILESETLRDHFNFIDLKTKAIRQLIEKITFEENNSIYRTLKSPFENIEYTRLSIPYREGLKELGWDLTKTVKVTYNSQKSSLISDKKSFIGKSEDKVNKLVKERQQSLLKQLNIEE